MIAELGTFFIIIALLITLLQTTYLIPAMRSRVQLCMAPASYLQALCATLALVILITLRLNNDFSVENVIAHSNISLPLLYKISGTWGNHEGSMLLWAWVMAFFGLMFLTGARCEQHLKHVTIACQSALMAGVLLFILFTSNPFERRFPPTADGQMLNPLLQDIALSMHPPLLYIGYVGFSIVFSLAVALLITTHNILPHPSPLPTRKRDLMKDWAKLTHPWILISWSALTIGIGLGSWWAYRELGWGGWWFWDPVENASLMPWLAGTALLHSNLVLKKRGLLGSWVVLLAMVTFGLSLLGTFLVRSGALTSVHSFASDPTRGLFILAYIGVVMGSGLTLYALRAGRLGTHERMIPASREGMIVINNLFILTACATVVLGTMYPLFAEWWQDSKLTVGAPYFNITFLPLMAIPLFFAGLVPFMPWKQASLSESLRRAQPALMATAACLLLIGFTVKRDIVLALIGFGLAIWLAAASLQWLRKSHGVRGAWSVFLGHMGAAIMVAGITAVSLWKEEVETALVKGGSINIAGYECVLKDIVDADTDNHKATRGIFEIYDSKKTLITTLAPEYRTYYIRKTNTSEASIYKRFGGDLYLVIGETDSTSGKIAVRAYYVPMIDFIWAGFIMITFAGITGIWRRVL